jgi:hypothetical protein
LKLSLLIFKSDKIEFECIKIVLLQSIHQVDMKLSASLSQNLSLQLSTSLSLDAGIEYIYAAVKNHEDRLLSPAFSREIKNYLIRAGKKSYFRNTLPSTYLLSGIPHLLEQTIHYAAQRHKGEYRNSGFPYLAHALSTGFILARLGLPKEIVLSGILHDAVEDVSDKNAVLNDLYNLMPEIAWYVYSVSGPDIKDAVEKDRVLKSRILAFSQQARNIFPQAIKCADGLANLYDLQFMEAKDGRTADERKLLFLNKSEDTIVPYARAIDEAGIIPIKKRSERFLLEDYVKDVIMERKQVLQQK